MNQKARVISRVKGGIGNQLFIYACARRLAITTGAELVLDHISGFTYDFEYKRKYQLDHFEISARLADPCERLEPLSRPRRYLKRKINQLVPLNKKKFIVELQNQFNQGILEFVPKGSVYLEGYWQNEKYFSDISNVIRSDLRIRSPLDQINIELAAEMRNSQSVAIHIRYFDLDEDAGDVSTLNASISYYERALKEIIKRVPDAHFYVFSDRPHLAARKLSLVRDRFTTVDHNRGDDEAYADLWLMTQCKHIITANSTFSWWAAWLGLVDMGIVIMPSVMPIISNANSGLVITI